MKEDPKERLKTELFYRFLHQKTVAVFKLRICPVLWVML